uniref:FERM domain-containing protein n=1 Tax=Parastrongyloides trichosuri TaxID=131310 RepID=A0A0N4Z164_PARTI
MDNYEVEYEDDPNDIAIPNIQKITRGNNILPEYGNRQTMNLNNLVYTNIIESVYWKEYLHSLTTFHQVQDEIIKKVKYLEPWEYGSRNHNSSCIGVRGVSAGGRITSAFCLLYKLFTLKLTRKQIVAIINNEQNTYLRVMGFLYIRYCQPPKDLYDWYEPYLNDKAFVTIKSKNGHDVTIGEILKHLLTNLDWYGTLLPRIPVPIQNIIDKKLGIDDKVTHIRDKNNDSKGYSKRNHESRSPDSKKHHSRLNGKSIFSKHKKSSCNSSSADSAISWNSYVEIVENVDIDKLSDKNIFLSIYTLDRQTIPIVADENSFLVEIYKKCCAFIGVQDMAYMGLCVRKLVSNNDSLNSKRQYEYYFLENEMKLNKCLKKFSYLVNAQKSDSKNNGIITLYLRIKYFTYDVSSIRCPIILLHYFLQMRNNFLQNQHIYSLINEELYWNFVYYLIQADGHGDDSNKLPYHKYFPGWMIKFRGILFIKNSLDQLNLQHKKVNRIGAMKKFCEIVTENKTFSLNSHLYFLKMKIGRENENDVTIAISDEGLVVWNECYKRMSVECRKIIWSKIDKMLLSKNSIHIESLDGFCGEFICQNKKDAKEIFLFCQRFHQQTLHFNLQAYNNSRLFGDKYSIFSNSEMEFITS